MSPSDRQPNVGAPRRGAPISAASSELSSLRLELRPRARCIFQFDSARSVHAALLRQIEQFDPGLSRWLHDAPRSAHGVVRPWTIANLEGSFETQAGRPVATPAGAYRARITALTKPICVALRHLLTERAGIALDLEHVTFDVRAVEERTTTYRELARAAHASERIELAWTSPTAVRRASSYSTDLAPGHCLASYLRRWNVFAEPGLRVDEEMLLEFAHEHLFAETSRFCAADAWPAEFRVRGTTGHSAWRCESGAAELMRQVNMLVDYAYYCGTGVKTALGMGQTARRCVDGTR